MKKNIVTVSVDDIKKNYEKPIERQVAFGLTKDGKEIEAKAVFYNGKPIPSVGSRRKSIIEATAKANPSIILVPHISKNNKPYNNIKVTANLDVEGIIKAMTEYDAELYEDDKKNKEKKNK